MNCIKTTLVIAAATMGLAATAAEAPATAPVLTTPMDSASYYVGVLNAHEVRQQMLKDPATAEFDAARFMKAYREVMALSGTADAGTLYGTILAAQMLRMQTQATKELGQEFNPELLAQGVEAAIIGNDGEMSESRNAFTHAMNAVTGKRADAEVHRNDSLAARYIAELMLADRSVKLTDEGLVYKVLDAGEGDCFTDDDRISVIYTGTHIDGTEFDSSKGNPVTFSPKQVVPGFAQALKLMRPGAHYIVYIPGKLGYGRRGQPAAGIGPNEMLIFDITTTGKAE